MISEGKSERLCRCKLREIEDGFTRCRVCIDRDNENNKQRRLRLKAAGICVSCGGDSGGLEKCKLCREKDNETQRARVQQRTISGHCIRCNKKIEENSTSRCCSECLQKNKIHNDKSRAKRKEENRCQKCGCKDKINTFSCERCYYKNASHKCFGNFSYWKELKELFAKQDALCVYSGLKLNLGIDTGLDHIIARNKGGENALGNVQWTHRIVNVMKSDFDEMTFLRFVKLIYEYRKLDKYESESF